MPRGAAPSTMLLQEVVATATPAWRTRSWWLLPHSAARCSARGCLPGTEGRARPGLPRTDVTVTWPAAPPTTPATHLHPQHSQHNATLSFHRSTMTGTTRGRCCGSASPPPPSTSTSCCTTAALRPRRPARPAAVSPRPAPPRRAAPHAPAPSNTSPPLRSCVGNTDTRTFMKKKSVVVRLWWTTPWPGPLTPGWSGRRAGVGGEAGRAGRVSPASADRL